MTTLNIATNLHNRPTAIDHDGSTGDLGSGLRGQNSAVEAISCAPADQLAGREIKIHEERRKKIHAARLKRKHNVLRDEIKLNKLEYKLTSQKLYSYQL